MDGIKPGRGHRSGQAHIRPAAQRTQPHSTSSTTRHVGEKYWLVRSLGKVASHKSNNKRSIKSHWSRFKRTDFAKWPDKYIWRKAYAIFLLVLFVFSTVAGVVQPFLDDAFYGVPESTRAVLPEPKQSLGNFLQFNEQEATFMYNDGYTGGVGSENALSKTGQGEPRISADFAKEASKGMTVTDPLNQLSFKMTPKFKLNAGKQDRNQVFYPLTGAGTAGYLVYTAQVASVKEDIVLEKFAKDRMEFEYELEVGDKFEAKLEKNGSVGIYGSSLPINGNVSTGSEQDAELLKKAQENGVKDKLLFSIPKPYVVESGREGTDVRSWFELTDGKNLKVVSEGLEQANYPLSIDPSVYVQSAAQLMRGNNETNVEFDVATEQFKKGTTTGARIDEWTDTTEMGSSVWDQGTAAAGGYIYKAGGKTSRVIPKIMSTTTTISPTATNTMTFNMPADRPNTDLYVIVIASQGTAATSVPGDLTVIRTLSNQGGVYYRYNTSVNVPATYTINTNTSANFIVNVLRIKDFNPSSIFNNTTGLGPSIQANVRLPAFTPNQNGTLTIGMVGQFNGAPTPNLTGYSPSTMHDVIAHQNSSGPVTSYISRYESTPLNGVAIPEQNVNTGTTSGQWVSTMFSINGIASSTTTSNAVEWAHVNSTNGSIDSPAPGSNRVACTNWCTSSDYNLPTASGTTDGAGLVGTQLIAYNGYLYNIGGYDGTNLKNTVYITKLGANGEPSSWHPTDSTQANWNYWYKASALPSARAYHTAYAAEGRMYLIGGRTSMSGSTPGALNTVHVADILPNGTLGSWTSLTALPNDPSTSNSERYSHAMQYYNGYLYVLGGNKGTYVYSTVRYTKINADGTINAWQDAGVTSGSGGNFGTGRTSQGGMMSGIWGAYIYLAGGCSAVNTTGAGNCTSVSAEVQLASINADGTLDDWNTMLTLRNQRFGYSFIAWQDSLYRIGGCSQQDATSGDCYGSYKDVQYGNINQDGDASTVSISQAYNATFSSTNPCSGDDPFNCNLPPGTGQALSASVILNGFLYVIGGCTTNACGNGAMSGQTSYAAIDSNGRLRSPPSCAGTVSGAWCIDSNTAIANGVGAAGTAVFNGNIYLIGGQNGAGGRNSILRNTPNADGSLSGAWDASQSLTGVGAITVSYTFAYARANPSSAANPGNLYFFGGCTSPATGFGCTAGNNYSDRVYKCNIAAAGTINGCAFNTQLSIGTVTGAVNPGLGIHAGAVYANYIYLIGGVADGNQDLTEIRYARFDNNNNVVAVSGGSWIVSDVETNNGRRRGTAFGYNGHLYVVGGFEATINQTLDTIEYTKVNVSNGSLESTIPKPGFPGKSLFTKSAVTINQRWGLAVAVSNSFAYVIGGCKLGASPTCSANGLDDTVQTFQLYNNDSGAPGGYTTSANTFANDRIGGSAAILNGYIYLAGGCISTTDCTDTTDKVEYAPIDPYGNIGTWTTSTNEGLCTTIAGACPTTGKAWGQLLAVKGALYYIGGQRDDGEASNHVFRTTSIVNGDPTFTRSTTNTPGNRKRIAAAVWNDRIYMLGGLNAAGSPAPTNSVYYSQAITGGDITSWSTGTAFNVNRSGATAIAYANNLYILGGYTGTTYLSDVQFSKINSNGSNGSWTYSTNLPYPVSEAGGFASNGYMYLLGGRSSTNDCTPRSLIAPISANTTISSGNNPTGVGEWYQTNRNFDGGRFGAGVTHANGRAYVLGGGCQGVVMQDDFDPALDGSMWTSTTGMTVGTVCQSTSNSNVLYTNSGGNPNPSAVTKDVNTTGGATVTFKIYSPTADGGGCFRREQDFSLFGGSNPDDILVQYSTNGGANWTTSATYAWNNNLIPMQTRSLTLPSAANLRVRWYMPQGEGNDSFSIEDVRIIAASSNEISLTNNTRVVYTSLLSQPQVASYSRLIDAGKDVFPTSWLMNGIDNSIGARWQMRYRSMNDPTATVPCGSGAMSSYGTLTNFGDVTLGLPNAYIVRDGSNNDIKCGRYFFMNISIDASQTYGYPDDIARGPTLDNLTLFFQSNPGSRLLHGKTFIEGEQQPLDTKCRQDNPLVSGNPSASGCLP